MSLGAGGGGGGGGGALKVVQSFCLKSLINDPNRKIHTINLSWQTYVELQTTSVCYRILQWSKQENEESKKDRIILLQHGG